MKEKEHIIEILEKYEKRILELEELANDYRQFCEEIMEIEVLNNKNLGIQVNKLQRKSLNESNKIDKLIF